MIQNGDESCRLTIKCAWAREFIGEAYTVHPLNSDREPPARAIPDRGVALAAAAKREGGNLTQEIPIVHSNRFPHLSV